MAKEQTDFSEPPKPVVDKVYNKNFILLFILEFTIFLVFYIILPIIPLYILNMGGNEAMIGWIIGLAGPIGALGVPLYGIMVDKWSPKKTIAIGMVASTASAFILPIIQTPWPVLISAVLRRIGTGASGTATRTMVIANAPGNRRGEAMTNFATSHNFAIAIGPSIGIALLASNGFNIVFIVSGTLMFFSMGMLFPISSQRTSTTSPQTKDEDQKFMGQIKSTFVKEVWAPAAATFFLSAAYLSTITFISVIGEQREIENYSMFFTVYAVVVIVGRLLTGKLSDRYGRAVILYPSLILGAVCMVLIAQAFSFIVLILASVALGFGFGTGNPMLQTIAADWAPEEKRGRAMSMLLGSFSFGSAMGTILIGQLSQIANFEVAFNSMAIMMLIALLISIVGFNTRNNSTEN
ncbi:MAG: MFS transporter [Dehalococcoidia bacterium]